MTPENTMSPTAGDTARGGLHGPSRRAVIGAAWAVPVIGLSLASPAHAASGESSITFGADRTVAAGVQDNGGVSYQLDLVGPGQLIIFGGSEGIGDIEYSLNITGSGPVASIRNLQSTGKPINVIFQNLDGSARFDIPGFIDPNETLIVTFDLVYRPNPGAVYPSIPTYTLQFSGPFVSDAFATVTGSASTPILPGIAITQPS